MAFDNTNSADLLALKNEVNLDPIGMGYASAAGTPPLLKLLNGPTDNVGGETVGADFTADLVMKVIDSDDITIGAKFSEGNARWLDYLMNSASAISNFADFESRFRAIFTDNPVTQTIQNLDAELKAISRAEVLFGIDTTISKADWLAARDS